MPQVNTELELVVAHQLGPVVDELVALFLLDQRAIATTDVEALADTVVASVIDPMV